MITRYRTNSDVYSYIVGTIVCGMIWTIIVLWLLNQTFADLPQAAVRHRWAVIVLGAIAMWRYIWVATHFVRALIYQFIRFPKIQINAEGAEKASHIYVVVLSYKMDTEINVMAYTAIARAINSYDCWGTIVACISEDADISVLQSLKLPFRVKLIALKQSGQGKRNAMEHALAFLANQHTPDKSYVALIDGDSIVPRDIFCKTVPLLQSNADIGALTTNNTPAVYGDNLIRQWYWLRMQHRHILMCSLALSRKVLVLTGRYSLFRAEIALSRSFILQVGRDHIDHWRLGRIRMLTGDDKSTWFYVLKSGWGMLYVPNIHVCCLEKALTNNLILATVPLMVRYFGNMARNNGRAIALGPAKIGLFPWWALIDQRISPWTTLLGPLTAVVTTIFWWPSAVPLYLCWAFFTRTIQSFFIGSVCGRFHPYMIFLLMYNQVVGAGVKLFVFFNLHRQKWTRQLTGDSFGVGDRLSALLLYCTGTVLVLCISLLVLAR